MTQDHAALVGVVEKAICQCLEETAGKEDPIDVLQCLLIKTVQAVSIKTGILQSNCVADLVRVLRNLEKAHPEHYDPVRTH